MEQGFGYIVYWFDGLRERKARWFILENAVNWFLQARAAGSPAAIDLRPIGGRRWR